MTSSTQAECVPTSIDTRALLKDWKNSARSSCVVRSCPSASVSPCRSKMQYLLHWSPRSTPTVKRSRLGFRSPRWCFSDGLTDATFGFSFSRNRPTSSANTSLVSRRPVFPGFAGFVRNSLFFPDLLSFCKVDLLIHCDCTVECVDQGSSSLSLIGDRPSHPIYRLLATGS